MKPFNSSNVIMLLCIAATACHALAIPKGSGEMALTKRGCCGDDEECCDIFSCCGKMLSVCPHQSTPTQATNHVFKAPETQQIITGTSDPVGKVGNIATSPDKQPIKAESKIVYETPNTHLGMY